MRKIDADDITWDTPNYVVIDSMLIKPNPFKVGDTIAIMGVSFIITKIDGIHCELEEAK